MAALHSFPSGDRFVCGKCDPDLYFMWLLAHTLDDSFGSEHLIRRTPELLEPWLSLLHALDDSFEGSFHVHGDSGEFVLFELK